MAVACAQHDPATGRGELEHPLGERPAPVAPLHQRRAAEHLDPSGAGPGVAGVDDDPVEQARVQRGDSGAGQRAAEGGEERVRRPLDRLGRRRAGSPRPPGRARPRSPRACPGRRGSGRSRSPGSTGREITASASQRRQDLGGRAGVGDPLELDALDRRLRRGRGSGTPAAPRRPAGVRTRVRTGCSAIGSTRASTPSAPAICACAAVRVPPSARKWVRYRQVARSRSESENQPGAPSCSSRSWTVKVSSRIPQPRSSSI